MLQKINIHYINVHKKSAKVRMLEGLMSYFMHCYYWYMTRDVYHWPFQTPFLRNVSTCFCMNHLNNILVNISKKSKKNSRSRHVTQDLSHFIFHWQTTQWYDKIGFTFVPSYFSVLLSLSLQNLLAVVNAIHASSIHRAYCVVSKAVFLFVK